MDLYLLMYDQEWEDTEIFVDKEDAIKASQLYPSLRVEIFSKKGTRYVPTFMFYKNGTLFNCTESHHP